MMNAPADVSSHLDAVDQILSCLHHACRPLTPNQVFDRLDKRSRPRKSEIERLLHAQAEAERVYRFPPYRGKADRFWDRPPTEFARRVIIDKLAEKAEQDGTQRQWAMTARNACQAAVKPSGLAQSELKPILEQLVQENLVYRLPPLPQTKSARYSTRRPDPMDYTEAEVKKVAEFADRLADCDVDRWEVFHATRKQLLQALGLTHFDAAAEKVFDRLRLLEPPSGEGLTLADLREALDFQLADGVDLSALVRYLAEEGRVIVRGDRSDLITADTRVSTRPPGDQSVASPDEATGERSADGTWGVPATTVPSATETTAADQARDTATPPSPSELDRIILDGAEELRRERYHASGLVPVHALRQWVAERAGEQAASHRVLDDRLKTLRGDGRLRLVAISETRGVSEAELAAAVPGVNETLFYVEPRR